MTNPPHDTDALESHEKPSENASNLSKAPQPENNGSQDQTPPEQVDPIAQTIRCMVPTGFVMALLFGLIVRPAFGVDILIGSFSAVINLLAYTWLVHRLLDSTSHIYVTLMMVKTLGLFAFFGWLLKNEFVGVLGFLGGYLSLPIGAVVAVLLPMRRP